ncbi:MAG: helix-turn-helix transcriptional regulator [Ruminococcaceae bacterium]|nr:helix-turn-helix transcriptional regulator [Oscillospiraceae bacterium]
MMEKSVKRYTPFGNRLRQLRSANHLTQERIAALLNLERSTYAKYETGSSMPHQDTLLRLAELFRVSVDYLLGNTPHMEGDRNELRDDGTLPGLDPEETAVLTVFRKLTAEQRSTLLAVANNYVSLNIALRIAGKADHTEAE